MKRDTFYQQGEALPTSLDEPRIRKVARILAGLKQVNGRFLDIGCGEGTASVYLGSLLKASEVHGINISRTEVEEANKKGIRAVLLDIEQQPLPYEADYFDCVFCGEVLEHVFDTDHVLDEVHRVLKPGGRCVITTPNLAGWKNRLVIFFGFQPYFSAVSVKHYNAGKLTLGMDSGAGREHLRNFTLRGLRDLVRIHGFHVHKATGVNSPLRNVMKSGWALPLILAENIFGSIPSLASELIMLVSKKE